MNRGDLGRDGARGEISLEPCALIAQIQTACECFGLLHKFFWSHPGFSKWIAGGF